MSDTLLYDSQTAYQGGMQSGVDPAQVAEHQYYRGLNLSIREGRADVRPSFDKLNMDTSKLSLSAGAYDEAEQNYDDAQASEAVKKAEYDAQGLVEAGKEIDYNNAVIASDNAVETAEATLSANNVNLLYHGDINKALVYQTVAEMVFAELFETSMWQTCWYNSQANWIAKAGESQAEVDAIVTYLSAIYALIQSLAGFGYTAALYENGNGNRLFDIADPLPEGVSITAYADNGSGGTTVTIGAHTIVDGEDLYITGSDTAGYNGKWTISGVTGTTFDIPVAFVDDPATKGESHYDLNVANRLKSLPDVLAIDTVYDSEVAALSAWQAEAAITEVELSEWNDAIAHTLQMKSILDSTIDFESVYKKGKFQGCEVYQTGNQTYVAAVISGHIFLLDLIGKTVTPVTNINTQLNQFVDMCYFVQVESYLIIQDGIAQPKILQGASLREADPTIPEIPRGTNMAYGHGRIAIQVSPKHLIMADIYLPYDPENVLGAEETGFLNEGGGFTVSGKLGKIISLEFANVNDTSTGDGPLLAICENGFTTFAINNPRAVWNDIAMQKIQLVGTGIVGSRASTNIHEDILYRSHEGIRSYAVGRQESSSGLKYTEMSKEVESYIQNDMQYDGQLLSMAYFDKRMLSLTAPKGIKARVVGHETIEGDYAEKKAAALLVDNTLTDENIQSEYEAKLVYVFDNTPNWTTKGTVDQGVVDDQVTAIEGDPDDKLCRIEKLIMWADSDIGGSHIDDLATLKDYSVAYLEYTGSFVDDSYFKGIIAFDFSLAGYTKSTQDSQTARRSTGAYDGIWTGIKATQIVTTVITGVKKCFCMAKDADNHNVIYEITKRQDGFDNRRKSAIECILETRAMTFKQEQTYVPSPFVYKKLEDIKLWLSGIEGDVNLAVYTSSDVVNAFTKIGELNLKAKTTEQLMPPNIGSPQSRAMIKLNDFKDDLFDETTKHPIRNGNEFIFRLVWTGKVSLRRFMAKSRKLEQDPEPNIETEAVAYPVDTFNQYRYSSE